MINKKLYKFHKIPLLVLILVSLNGCGTTGGYKGVDYIHAIEKVKGDEITSVYDQARKDSGYNDPVEITDNTVYKFANNIKNFMEIRVNQKKTWRKLSSSAQVLSAAAAAALTAFEKSVSVIAGLAGFSAIIPELQNIFQAREGAAAFSDGIDKITVAINDFDVTTRGKYLNKCVSDKHCLSCAGVELKIRVEASIRLVDTALLQQIPKIEDMEKSVTRITTKVKSATDAVKAAAKKEVEKAAAKIKADKAEDNAKVAQVLAENLSDDAKNADAVASVAKAADAAAEVAATEAATAAAEATLATAKADSLVDQVECSDS